MESGTGIVRVVVFYLERKERIVEDATAQHEIVDRGESLSDATVVGRGADVAVIDDFVAQQGKYTAECVEVYLA